MITAIVIMTIITVITIVIIVTTIITIILTIILQPVRDRWRRRRPRRCCHYIGSEVGNAKCTCN